MPDPLSPKSPAKSTDLSATRSSANADTGGYRADEIEANETDVASFLAPPQGEGELGRLAHYRVMKELGRGGMGMVLLAEDVNLRRLAAIKIMLPRYAKDPAARERFLREARAAARLKHDNVVTIFQVDEANGIPFIAMEFLEGQSLDQYLKEHRGIPIGQTLRIGREISEGLQAAHAKGLIHRDIKPANVWLEAPKGRVKILDFGLAREQRDDTNLTQSGAVIGTPAYMSPEQAAGKPLDPRSDLFSLGVVLYRLCTGQQPFTGPSTMAVLMALGTETPTAVSQLNPNVPVALEQLIQRLMAKDRDQRPGSAEEVAEALAAIEKPANSGGTSGGDSTAPARATGSLNKPRSRRLLFAGLAGVFAIVAAFIVVKLSNKDGAVTDLKVPDESKVEVTQNGKVVATVDPDKKKDSIVEVEPKKVDPPPFVPSTPEEKEAKKQQEEWATKLKLPVEAENKIGMKMILIPPAGPALPKAYYLGKYEVTQAEWENVMGDNPSDFGPNYAKATGLDTSKLPVENVNWFDSVEFCNKLSEYEELKPYYDLKVTKRGDKEGKHIEEAEVKILGGSGYHIPTDLEWDRGCRAGTKSKYHFGDKDEDLLDYAWIRKNSDGRSHAVGEKKPNAFGLYDMHGNVWEWNEEMLTNANTGATHRLARGGYWNDSDAATCAVSSRAWFAPTHPYTGLRLARIP